MVAPSCCPGMEKPLARISLETLSRGRFESRCWPVRRRTSPVEFASPFAKLGVELGRAKTADVTHSLHPTHGARSTHHRALALTLPFTAQPNVS
jgi:hypothetical protein